MRVSVLGTTEGKRAEKEKTKLDTQLKQSHKMEAIATLAGGIAHQFNNALVGITGNIELLEMDLSDNGRIEKYIEPMKASVSWMSHLTNQLLAYARGGKYQPRTISLSDFVKDTLPLLKHSIDPTIQIEADLQFDICNIEADVTQMQMMLSAVVINAVEALEGEGNIRVLTREEEIVPRYPDIKPGQYVCLIVEDNGRGMDDATRDRIFEPFFTTKLQGRGLGMAAVYGIVRNHNGWISVDSALGRRTVIRIYLPAIKDELEEALDLNTELLKGTGTILVIEDEEIVMDVTREILKRLGYDVLEAKTGMEALDLTKDFNGDIDLAILDIGLPDMGGNMVYPRMKEIRPDLKVIVCSGYTIDGPAQEILESGAQGFIQKPYSLTTLSATLHDVLES